MQKRTRKILLLSGKILLATLLLAWVVSQVHFRDFVRTRQGESYSLLSRETDQQDRKVFIVDASGWWTQEKRRIPAREVEPIDEGGERYVRPGFFTNLRTVRPGWLLTGIFGFALAVFWTAVRWQVLLGVQRVRIGLWESLRLTVLGEFFNHIVPGTVGGDLVKAYYVSSHTHLRSGVLISVMVDRLLGLAMLALLSVTMVLVLLGLSLESLERIYPSLIASLICLGAIGLVLLFLLSGRLRAKLPFQRLIQRLPISHHLKEASEAAWQYRSGWRRIALAAGITFLAHASWITGVWLVGLSVGLSIPYYMFVVYIPLIYILGAVPITPGGVGLIEKLYVAFFAANPAGVLAMALLVRLIKMAVSLPGLLVTVTGARIPKAEEIESELGVQTAAEGSGQGPDTNPG